jgi:hypothetical protein
MQNSALYRQGVVVPLDEEAEDCLRRNNADSSTNVQFVEVPSREVFAEVWRLELFAKINARCTTLIDEYEEEWVDPSAAAEVLAVIDLVSDSTHDPATLNFLRGFRALVSRAQALSRPMLFVL